MHYIAIELKGQTASFRNPEFQNFHKSYALPPPSTVIGLLGAAMGLSPKDAQAYAAANIREMGCWGKKAGEAKDLWKYHDKKKKKTSVILREFFYQYQATIAFGCPQAEQAQAIAAAFRQPAYALTLGNSDSLAKVVRFHQPQVTSSKEVSHCWVEGNVLEQVLEKASNEGEFSIYQTSNPVAYDMPVHFAFKTHGYSPRSIAARKTVSIVAEPMQLNFQVQGLEAGGRFIPMLKFPSHE